MSQGEDSTEPRKADGLVPIARIPDLVRALGYYPTEAEVANMLGEAAADADAAAAAARAAGEAERAAALGGCISLAGFIKLYVNHRPVFGVGKEQIDAAFETLVAPAAGASGGAGGGGMAWEELSKLLRTEGERMSTEELQRCLGALVGDEDLPSHMTALGFADKVLGFEDYAEEQEEEGGGGEE